MRLLYDTRKVPPLERYEYYREGTGRELAPVSVHGREPGRLHAAMSVAWAEDLEIVDMTWGADSSLMARRTERHIRACDPGYHRLLLCLEGVVGVEQQGTRAVARARDVAWYDLSRPCGAAHGLRRGVMRAVMLSFPRTWVSFAQDELRSLAGTVVPRRLPGLDAVTQFVAGVAEAAGPDTDPELHDVLRECVVRLVREWVGLPGGLEPHARRTVLRAHVRNVMRQRLGDPGLSVGRIAMAANMSPRGLYLLFQGSGDTPARLLKRLRLRACHRALLDPATTRPIMDVAADHGYVRPDQFARDFRQEFGLPPSQVRRLAIARSSAPDVGEALAGDDAGRR
ncbi:MAG TPA: helix-turn-helix domain-containing protein [Pseudonocardiaceae bacterium]